MSIDLRNDAQLPAHLQREIDRLCDQFEAAWQSGARPQLEKYLSDQVPPARGPLLHELLRIDLGYRRRLHETPRIEEYLVRLPDDEPTIRSTFRQSEVSQSVTRPYAAPSPFPREDPSVEVIEITGYRVLGQIRAGGMGAVYRVLDDKFRRPLAVKLLLPRSADSAEARARFLAEAQITGQLQHPGIPPVHEMGQLADGRPFFTMKLIEGRTLSDLLAERAAPQAELHRFLSIFEQIAQTLAYAHAQGVIHRDLKPQNVMVGAFGEVQLMDWGLAKRMRNADCGLRNDDEGADGLPRESSIRIPQSAFRNQEDSTVSMAGESSSIRNPQSSFRNQTELGAVMGTYAYMPPEQARGEVELLSERSDVFGLGAILCEILTGFPPYRGVDDKPRAQQAREADLSDALTRLQSCGADAALIDLSRACLSAASADRPSNAGIVAQHIRDHLATVQERLEQARAERAAAEAKAVEVRKRLSISAAFAASLLLGAIGLIAGLLVLRGKNTALVTANTQIEGKNADLLNANESERQAKNEANTKRQEAESAQQETQQVMEYLVAALRKPDPAADGEKLTVAQLLDQAVASIDESFPDQALTQARFLHAIGHTYVGLGLYDRAVQVHTRATDLFRSHFGEHDLNTLGSLHNLAGAYWSWGKFEQALPLQEQALAGMQAKLGNSHRDTLNAMNNLANAYHSAGKVDRAVPLIRKTLKLQRDNLGVDHPDTLRSMNNLASTLESIGELDEAVLLHQKTLNRRRETLEEDHLDILQSMHNLAHSYQSMRKWELALPLYEDTLQRQRAKLGEHHPKTLTTLGNTAQAYEAAGRLEEALPYHQQAFEGLRAKLGPDHFDTLKSMNNLALAHKNLGNLAQALPLHQESLERSLASLGADHLVTFAARSNLALAYEALGQLDKAFPLFEQNLKWLRENRGQDHIDTLAAVQRLAVGYRLTHQFDKALPLFKHLVERSIANQGDDHPNTLTLKNDLASVYHALGQGEKALPLIEEVLAKMRERLGEEHSDTVTMMNNLAAAYWTAGRLDQSIPLFENVLKTTRQKFGLDHANTIQTMINLGVNYRDDRRLDLAIPLLEDALLHIDKYPAFARVGLELALAYDQQGRMPEAELLYRTQVKTFRDEFGPAHAEYAYVLALLAENLLRQKEFDASERVWLECHAIREKVLAGNWKLYRTKSLLGAALVGNGTQLLLTDKPAAAAKFAQAEPLLVQGFEGIKVRETSIPAKLRAPQLTEALERLVDLYTVWDKPDEADKWRKKFMAESQKAAAEGT